MFIDTKFLKKQVEIEDEPVYAKIFCKKCEYWFFMSQENHLDGYGCPICDEKSIPYAYKELSRKGAENFAGLDDMLQFGPNIFALPWREVVVCEHNYPVFDENMEPYEHEQTE